MKKQLQYLYHSSVVGGLTYLDPRPLKVIDGFHRGERGIWAADNIKFSRVFGISPRDLGAPRESTIEFRGKKVILIEVSLSDIPDDLIAYTYYVSPKDFEKVDPWQYLAKKPVKVQKVVPYKFKEYLTKHFEVYELDLKRVS
ncbi:MAG: hypothetical protein AAB495_00495 [Patescibacteria group bacterium]